MKKLSRPFYALWTGEIVSEFAGVAGGIINGLMVYELTGSKGWMSALWLVYFLPSLLLQALSSPFLNHVTKETVIKNIQLIRAGAYVLPLFGFLVGTDAAIILALIVLQCLLGLMQPIYATLSFALIPDICEEKHLTEANALLDGTIRLMSFIAPAVTSLFLLLFPLHVMYGFSSLLFLASFFALLQIPSVSKKKTAVWTKRFWLDELIDGFRTFFAEPLLLRLTFLSSSVQFAVGATMVLSVPFIRGELAGDAWEYAIFSGAFPVGYAIGVVLLSHVPKINQIMYLGLIGGGLSFMLLFFVQSVPAAWVCELFGGLFFPLFNARSASIFQSLSPRERLPQLSAVRLLFLRVTMPLGILFASSPFFNTRQIYIMVGMLIVIPGLFYFLGSLFRPMNGSNKRII